MISNDQKFNLGQLNAYKLMFAIRLPMEKQIKNFLSAGLSDLPAINATVFNRTRLMFLNFLLNLGPSFHRRSGDQFFSEGPPQCKVRFDPLLSNCQ